MRLYGKRFLRRSQEREAQRRIESRDAIVWDVIPDDRVCRVKVQGSNEFIIAWYPENDKRIPEMVKPGNAVRIAHVGGVRGRIEVVGHGLRIPTPVSGATLPTPGIGPDTVVEGMNLRALESPAMRVFVEPGTYRINGVTYSFTGSVATMGTAPVPVMGSGIIMGESGNTVVIDAAPAAGWFRYDLITIDAAGNLYYVKGTAWQWPGYPTLSGEPTMPLVPGGQVSLGHILVHGGATGITQEMIGRYFERPRPGRIAVGATKVSGWAGEADDEIGWGSSGVPYSDLFYMQRNVTFSILDQYDNPYSFWSSGEINVVEVRIVSAYEAPEMGTLSRFGVGEITGGGVMTFDLGLGYQASLTLTRPHVWTGDPSYTQGNATDYSPLIEITLVSSSWQIKGYLQVGYLNASGQRMPVP